MNDTLAVVPARGGSKGVPRKNLRMLDGRPLIAYPIEAGLKSRRVNRVVVSTDDTEIADVARSLGADVPFARPARLALDDSPTLPVIQHVIAQLREAEGYVRESVVILQPTAPLTTARHVDEALDLLSASGADAVVSVAPIPAHCHPEWVFRLDGDRLSRYAKDRPLPPRRQDLESLYFRNGAIYAARASVVLAGSLYGSDTRAYVMDPMESANVDAPIDLLWAELLLRLRQQQAPGGMRAPTA